MSDNFAEDFRLHGADITVERIALNPDQVAHYTLPTRPSKTTDSRTRRFTEAFGEGSVKLDALPSGVLTELIEQSIRDHIADVAWNVAFDREQDNRAKLGTILRALPSAT